MRISDPCFSTLFSVTAFQEEMWTAHIQDAVQCYKEVVDTVW